MALAVSDVSRSASWYAETLGFERRYEGMWNDVPVFMGKGDTAIALFPKKADLDSQGSWPMRHLAFRADRRNFVAAQEELRARGIDVEFQDHEISHSIYFQDPDGIKLEITTYEIG